MTTLDLSHIADAVRVLRPGDEVRDALRAVEAACGHVYVTPMDGRSPRSIVAMRAAWTDVCRELDAQHGQPVGGIPLPRALIERARTWSAASWWLTRAIERAALDESTIPHSGTTRVQVASSPITASKETTR